MYIPAIEPSPLSFSYREFYENREGEGSIRPDYQVSYSAMPLCLLIVMLIIVTCHMIRTNQSFGVHAPSNSSI